jgi:hypothetical protein
MREHESQDDRGEGDTFDEGGRDQHVCADASGGFGLTGNSFASLATDLTDAATGADHGQTHSDGCATDADTLVGNERRCLRQQIGKFHHEELLPGLSRIYECRRFVWENPVVG